MEAHGSTVNHFRLSTPSKTLRLHVVQLVISQVLTALDILHRAGIIHTGKDLVLACLLGVDQRSDLRNHALQMFNREMFYAPIP